MRKSIYILSILSLGLFSCSSQKKLQKETPFQLGSASCQHWAGGKEESGTGLILKIPIMAIEEGDVAMQNVYFRGKMTKLNLEIQEGKTYAIAKFEEPSMEKPDIIMHADPKQEVGNRPPKMKDAEIDFPFELADDEAVISYMEKEKLKYAKISGIKEKAPLIYNSKPMN